MARRPDSDRLFVVEGKRLLGTLTERDIIRLVASRIDLAGVTVAEIADRSPVTLSLAEGSASFVPPFPPSVYRTRYLPVVNERGDLVGLLDETDLARASGERGALPEDSGRAEARHPREDSAIRESEERFRLALDLTSIGVCDARPADGILFWDTNLYRLLGYRPGEVEPSYQLWESHVHPDDRTDFERELQRARESDTPAEFEYRTLRRDGSVRWFSSKSRWLYDGTGRPLRIISIISDITERVSAGLNERFLDELDVRLRHLPDADAMVRETVKSLGEYLDVGRVEWHEVKLSEDLVTVARDRRREEGSESESASGIYHLSEFIPPELSELYRTGRAAVVGDVATSPLTAPLAGNFAARGIGSFAGAPYLSDGRWIAILAVNSANPREWRPETVALLQATINRLYPVVERARVIQELRESEERFRQMAESIGEVFWMSDIAIKRMLYVSPAYEEVWGRSRAELYERPQSFLDAIHPEDLARVLATIKKYKYSGFSHEYRLLRSDGSVHWISERAVPVRDAAGRVYRLTGVSRDITDQKTAEIALQESRRQYRNLVENSPDLIERLDTAGRHLYISPSVVEVAGIPEGSFLGRTCRELGMPLEMVEIWERTIRELLATGRKRTIEFEFPAPDGLRFYEAILVPELDSGGEIVSVLSISRDVTERKRTEEELARSALHDPLTGLPNRALLLQQLELCLQRCRRSQEYRFAVLFIDLDRFKMINDSLGHLAGDRFLVAIAARLQGAVRATDAVARLGGDEFAILLDGIEGERDAVLVTERVLGGLREPLSLEGQEVHAAASIGIVLGRCDYSEVSHLLRDADIAMYRAKASGRGRYEIFDTLMHARVLDRMRLESDLRTAGERGEFIVHYQPLLSLDTNRPIKFEALLRWRHPTRGLVSPDEFIPVAEETGLIVGIDRWLLRTVCRQLRGWRERFPRFSSLRVSVNLSGRDLREPDLLETVDRLLAETGLEGSALSVEITESVLIEDIEGAIGVLSRLRDRGIRVCLDDFGTGYSSLGYLYRLPVDTLKIDRSFVSRMESEGGRDYKIVAATVSLARQLGLATVAEGIETERQLRWLRELGCDLGQGYLFAPPLPPESLESLFLTGL